MVIQFKGYEILQDGRDRHQELLGFNQLESIRGLDCDVVEAIDVTLCTDQSAFAENGGSEEGSGFLVELAGVMVGCCQVACCG